MARLLKVAAICAVLFCLQHQVNAAAQIMAALTALNSGLDSGLKANDLVDKSLKTFNTLVGSSAGIWDKVRPLEIRVTNLHPEMKLRMEDSWFDSGRFWSQPFADVYPGQSVTFYVCNKDGSIMTGVSGGVGFRVMNKDTEETQAPGWLVCTFSNPWSGSIKGKVAFKEAGIGPQFNSMDDDRMTKDEYTGFYKVSDRVLQFVFKSSSVKW